MSDKNLGYIVLVLGFSGFCIGAFLLIRMLPLSPELRIAVFPQIGNLRLEDPVRLNGLEVGRIKSIEYDERRVYLTLMFPDPVEIRHGYELETIDKGILGDRYIVLAPGKSSAQAIPAQDTLHGEFRPGPSEVLGRMGELKGWIARVDSVVANLQEGDEETPPFAQRFKEIVGLVDTTLRKAQTATAELEQAIPRQTARLNTFTQKTDSLVQSMERSIPELLTNLNNTLERLDNLVAATDSMVIGLEKAVAVAQDKENILWGDDIDRLSENLDKINSAIKEVYEFSFQLKLLPKLGFRDE